MPVYTSYQWQTILTSETPWSASELILRNLLGYRLYAPNNSHVMNRDREQLENCLLAYSAIARTFKQYGKPSGPIPVISTDLDVEGWKAILRKLTVTAAAETVTYNFLSDPACDLSYANITIRRVLMAWSELQLEARGIGTGIAPDEPPEAA